MSTCKLKWATW
uniref:Uncharacterized protein n=1 Tax=Rhizophora mucronata TaxID=61149 RepID=A0A2P2NWH9_RHIMU